jgi:hypothetical protein
MKNFVIVKKEETTFNSKVELISTTCISKTDCFQEIEDEIEQDKIKWLNITDKLRKFEVNKTGDTVELIVYKNSRVDSSIVSTIIYKVVEI